MQQFLHIVWQELCGNRKKTMSGGEKYYERMGDYVPENCFHSQDYIL